MNSTGPLNSNRLEPAPFEFGDIVYHRARTEKVAGIVIATLIMPEHRVKVLVRWGDNLEVVEHHVCELSSEFEPLL
jgi:hypothetical protein